MVVITSLAVTPLVFVFICSELCLFCSPHGNDKMILNGAMRSAAFTIAVAFLCGTAAAAAPLVTYQSACECLDNHGKQRWAEKNDLAQPPSDASAIQVVKPSDIFNWEGPYGVSGAKLTT